MLLSLALCVSVVLAAENASSIGAIRSFRSVLVLSPSSTGAPEPSSISSSIAPSASSSIAASSQYPISEPRSCTLSSLSTSASVTATTSGSIALSSPTAPAPVRVPVPGCRSAPTGVAKLNVNVCKAKRFCDPTTPSNRSLTITGKVQQAELESVLAQIQRTPQFLENGWDDVLSHGAIGIAASAAGRLFEVTGDIRFLDNAVTIADNMLAMRNDPANGRVMWDGIREPVWPTKPANAPNAGYAGCESMEVAGWMVQPALYILKNPCLWRRIPQQSNVLSNFTSNSTYLDRALAYTAAADLTFSYFRTWFFAANGQMQQPDDPRWNAVGDIRAGTPMPWNRRAMMTGAMLKLAAIHSVPNTAVNDLTFTAELEHLVDVQVRDFISAMRPAISPNDGTTILSWAYTRTSNGQPAGSIESTGLHGLYDFWGLFEAWRYGIATDKLNSKLMTKLANTLQHGVWKPQWNAFAGMVNGLSDQCNQNNAPRSWLDGRYAYLARWSQQWLDILATKDLKQQQRLEVAAPLLVAKAALDSAFFWTGRYVLGNDTKPAQA